MILLIYWGVFEAPKTPPVLYLKLCSNCPLPVSIGVVLLPSSCNGRDSVSISAWVLVSIWSYLILLNKWCLLLLAPTLLCLCPCLSCFPRTSLAWLICLSSTFFLSKNQLIYPLPWVSCFSSSSDWWSSWLSWSSSESIISSCFLSKI